MNTLIRNAVLLTVLPAVVFITACSKPDPQTACPECDASEPLDPVDDLAAYLSLDRQALFVAPADRQRALQALNAVSLGNGAYEATLNPLYGVPFNIRFTVVEFAYPSLFLDLDEGVFGGLDDALDAIEERVQQAADAVDNAAADTARQAALEAIDAAAAAARAAIEAAAAAAKNDGNGQPEEQPEEEPVGGSNEVLFDNVKGVAVWKNARCGSPVREAGVTACQGPIPPDGEELAGLFWRSTYYTKAKCVKGNGICTEIRQAGGFIEFAIDNQCTIVQDIKPLFTNLYCQ